MSQEFLKLNQFTTYIMETQQERLKKDSYQIFQSKHTSNEAYHHLFIIKCEFSFPISCQQKHRYIGQ